jgi:predicted RNA-binding Zn-ribbon protein involved in translation (DUF1610 family)
MKKNIELFGGGLKCDNPECDYVNMEIPRSEYEKWINKPCPKCGENLLTEDDYMKSQFLESLVDMVNEMDLDIDPNEPRGIMTVDVHNNKIEITTDIEEPNAKKKPKKSSHRKKD